MKRIAEDVHHMYPKDVIATRKEASHASGMETEITRGLVMRIIVSKIYCI